MRRAEEEARGHRDQLALIAKQHVDVRRVDLNQVIHDVIELLGAEMKKRGVAIRLELTKGLPPAKGDPIELQQVMLNLLLNGAQAMDAVEPESRVLVVRSSTDDGELLVSVEDRDVGLDEETKEEIFEPFFTTRVSIA
jgi:C4-dicarboxylate-specific signal transduction histidine kinase